MKFGVREICNVVFRAASAITIGNKRFEKGQPVFYLDSAKTSSMEGSATTVYAQGGRGNARLIAWEGEKTLTFTVEDALLSPVSFAILSGAGVVKGQGEEDVHFHQTTMAVADADGIIDLSNALEPTDFIDTTAPLFIMTMDDGGDIKDTLVGKYNIVEADDESVDRKKLQYGNKNELDVFNGTDNVAGNVSYNASTQVTTVTGNNGTNCAYPFPYTIYPKEHVASREAVKGWNDAIADTTNLMEGYPIFAEPVPTSLLKVSAKNSTYLPEEIWTVAAFAGGTSLSINLPSQLASPLIDVTASNASQYFTKDSGTLAEGTYKVLTKKDTDWPSDNNVQRAGYVLRKESYDQLNIGKDLPSVYIIKMEDGSAIGSAIKVTLKPKAKAQALANYFGVDTKLNGTTITSNTKDTFTDNKLSAYGARAKAELRYQRAQEATDTYNAYMTTANKPVMVDYYVIKKSATVTELQIDATNFGGYYYVEADTLFRRQIDGKDMPANLTFPNVKIQSNFTFSMAATGDPSTFTFTMDAFPGYTYFDKTRKVLCAIQIVDDVGEKANSRQTVFPHFTKSDLSTQISQFDSSPDVYDERHHSKLGLVELDG